MFRRLTSFILVVCLLSSFVFTGSVTTVKAEETQSDSQGKEQAFSPGDSSLMETQESSEFNMLNSLPQVNVVDSQFLTNETSLFKSENTAAADVQRYTVLVLDTSASSRFLDYSGNVFYTVDTAVEYVKASAKKIVEKVHSASGTNYIAIVTYKGASATVVSQFSSDLTALTASIDSLYASQYTRNVAAGLQAADSLITGITDPTAIKNVVLFTTGMTNDGSYNS